MKKFILVLLVFAFSLTACNNKNTASSYQVVDFLGREVTFEKEPTRIVSPYYISTSMVMALGLTDQLVGVEDNPAKRPLYTSYAPQLCDLQTVGTLKSFDLEACVALHPDLVILPLKLKDMLDSLEQLSIPTIVINPESQELLESSLMMIGEATHHEANAKELIGFIQDSLSELQEKIKDKPSPSIYLGGNKSILSTAGKQMYQNTLIENAGGINVAKDLEDTYWAEISYEQLLVFNPDVIVLASDATYSVEDVLNDTALSSLKAVQNKQVYQIPGDIEALDSPVPASFLGSFYIASVIYDEDYYQDVKDAYYARFY